MCLAPRSLRWRWVGMRLMSDRDGEIQDPEQGTVCILCGGES